MAPSITDWIQALGAAATAVISLFVLLQIRLASEQLKLSREQTDKEILWNKLNATFVFLNGEHFDQKERRLAVRLLPLGLNLLYATEPISEEMVGRIREDVDVYAEVKSFLNLLEDYATAVRVGVVDAESAYAIISGQLIRYGNVMMPLIQKDRAITDDDEFYIEFEKLYLEWRSKFEQQREVSLQELERARRDAERRIADAHSQLKQKKGITTRY